MKEHGSLMFLEPNDFSPALSSRWAIQATPDIILRLKRIFPRAQQNRKGAILLSDTPEVARDIEWVLSRWPLRAKNGTLERLSGRAQQHRDTEASVNAILAGVQPPLELRDPARPAREYQRIAADLALSTGSLLLADELGLGKSMSGLLVLREPKALPALVVTLTHLPPQWMDELEKTLPWLRAHIIQGTRPYDPGRRRGGVPHVLVMNYAKLVGWADALAGRIRTVIFDEVQELRRSSSKKYHAAAQIADQATYRVGLTATPVYNYGGEIHNVLSVLAPDALGTREEFGREWGIGDREDAQKVREPAALGTFLREQGLMLRRTRADVGRELPEVVRVPHRVETDRAVLDELLEGALDLAELILDEEADQQEAFVAAGDFDWRMRQATGIAKAPYVAEFVRLLLESEQRIVLFGWHRAVYELWKEGLEEFNPVFYTGAESAVAKKRSSDAFLSGDSRVLIMSLRAGAGLDGLQEAASTLVFGELDWSPGIHDQCVGRLHRDGQASSVVAYFLVSDEGADPVMAEVLNLKRMQSQPIVDPDAPLFEGAPSVGDRVKLLAQEALRRRRS